MMLEYALEKFPLSLKLRDGTACVVRPLGKRDDTRLHKFFLAVPEEERLFIKQPLFDRALVRAWCRHADFERNLPLLMLDGQKIIGEATLHQRFGGWKRHIGLISVLTHPQYRGRDVAKILVAEQVEIARALGLARLEAELNGERKVAIRALEQIGFQHLMKLEDYVLDMKAVTHDFVLMGMSLKTDEEYAGVGG
jgi:RimJ/RimL family protein N-acetyltransferase